MRETRRRGLTNAGLITLCLVVATALWSGTAHQSDAQPPPPAEEISLGLDDAGISIQLSEGQVLSVVLPANPTTGYTWEVADPDTTMESGQILRLLGEVDFEPESDLLGAPGLQTLRFEQLSEGVTTLEVVYHRPWEVDVPSARTFSAQVRAAGPSGGTTPVEAAPTQETVAEENGTTDVGSGLGLPGSYNWCSLGACTPVRDQGACGSCWAFATVGPLESKIKLLDGIQQDLSEQYLVSCNTDGWSCCGGDWAHDYHLSKVPPSESQAGAVLEGSFPYGSGSIPCGSPEIGCSGPYPHPYKIASWAYVGPADGVPATADIKQAIYDHGPVAVGICVDDSFAGYTGGVFQTNETCAYDVNHGVVLVGWNDTDGAWILRNSWGTAWGESGYMRIKYGTSNVGYSANYITYSPSLTQAAYVPLIIKSQPPSPPPPPNTFYAVADSCVLQGYPTANFGDTIDMWVGYDDYLNPDGKIARSLIRFNLSAIPTGTAIDSAVLGVYLVSSWDYPGQTRTITTYRIASTWSEMGVTWNNKPSFSTAYGSAPVTHGEWGWYSFNVTNLVRGWINGTIPNRGVMLRGPEWSGADSSWKSFSTREDYSHEPRLVITYTGAGAPSEAQIGAESPGEAGRTIVDTLTGIGSATVSGANLCEGMPAGSKCLAMQ